MNSAAFEFFKKGSDFQQRGVYDCAVREYAKALKLEPDNLDILLNCGAACLQKGWADKAVAMFVKVLEQDPDNTLGLYNIGKAFLYLEDYESAADVFKRLNSITPDDNDVKRLLASTLRQIGKYREAVDINMGLMEYLGSDVKALLELAGDLKMLKRYDEALRVYKEASSIARDSVEPLIGIYECNYRTGNAEKALAAIKRAILLEPQNQELIIMLVDMFLEDGKIQEAAETVIKGMESIPNADILRAKYDEMVRRLPILKKKTAMSGSISVQSRYETEVYDILDSLYDGKTTLNAAVNSLEALRNREPGDLLVSDELANLFFQARDYDKAAEIYSDLLIHNSEAPKHRIDLAKSLAMQGDIVSARNILNDSIRDLGFLTEFELALTELDIFEKDFEKAAERLEDLLKKYPDEVHGLFLYAYTAMRLNNLELAEAAFNKLFAAGNFDEELAVWYSRLCIIKGSFNEAFKVWGSFSDGMESLVELISKVELTLAAGDSVGISKYLQRIGEYKPRFIEDHMLFGKAFFFAGEFSSAQHEFELVLKFEKKNAEALAMSAMTSLIRNKATKFWHYWQLAVNSDSLYAIIPPIILKNSFNFIQRKRLRDHTQKLLDLMVMTDIDRERLNRLMEIL